VETARPVWVMSTQTLPKDSRISHSSRSKKATSTLLNNCCTLAFKSSPKSAQSHPFLLSLTILSFFQKTFGPSHPETIRIKLTLANLYQRKSLPLKTIEPIYLEALQAYKATFQGRAHPDMAVVYNDLGTLFATYKENLKAEENYAKSLEMWQEVYGSSHPSVGEALINLAEFLESVGKREETFALYLRAKNIFEKFFPAEHPLLKKVNQKLK
jgi:tetratricopeptide (TPR) repeat protein